MGKVVLFQGDSITDAGRDMPSGGNLGYGYATMVTGALSAEYPYDYTFYNRGISGNRVVDVYARIKEDIINLKPDYMSLLIGVNDVWHEYACQNGIDAEKFEKLYNMLLDEIRTALPNIKIMLLEPFVLPGSATRNTPETPDRWEYFRKEVDLRRAVVARIAQQRNLPFVPLQELFDKVNADAPEMGYWLKDGVHPSAAGHELIKREWLKTFEQMK